MGTYWDNFLKQYPFVQHCALETILELFYFYCDMENQDLFKEKEKRVREQFYAPPVSESLPHTQYRWVCSKCDFSSQKLDWDKCPNCGNVC